jgi:hypothetical protein
MTIQTKAANLNNMIQTYASSTANFARQVPDVPSYTFKSGSQVSDFLKYFQAVEKVLLDLQPRLSEADKQAIQSQISGMNQAKNEVVSQAIELGWLLPGTSKPATPKPTTPAATPKPTTPAAEGNGNSAAIDKALKVYRDAKLPISSENAAKFKKDGFIVLLTGNGFDVRLTPAGAVERSTQGAEKIIQPLAKIDGGAFQKLMMPYMTERGGKLALGIQPAG